MKYRSDIDGIIAVTDEADTHAITLELAIGKEVFVVCLQPKHGSGQVLSEHKSLINALLDFTARIIRIDDNGL